MHDPHPNLVQVFKSACEDSENLGSSLLLRCQEQVPVQLKSSLALPLLRSGIEIFSLKSAYMRTLCSYYHSFFSN